MQRKAMSRTSWYRPYSAVSFYPPTPGRVLPGRLQAAMTEEAARIGVTVKIIEGGGQPLHTTGTSSASTSPSARCGTAGRASPPRRRGGGRQPHPGLRPLSRGLHPVCPSPVSGGRQEGRLHHRLSDPTNHRSDILRGDTKNAMAKHTANISEKLEKKSPNKSYWSPHAHCIICCRI